MRSGITTLSKHQRHRFNCARLDNSKDVVNCNEFAHNLSHERLGSRDCNSECFSKEGTPLIYHSSQNHQPVFYNIGLTDFLKTIHQIGFGFICSECEKISTTGCINTQIVASLSQMKSGRPYSLPQVVDPAGAPGTTRTCDPLIRSQVLYPAELRVRSL